MYVIRLPNGNLQVPQTAIRAGGGQSRVIGNAYVEIGPHDADYERLAAHAITPDQMEERRAAWKAGNAALEREFLEFARLAGDQIWSGADDYPETD
ncbi:MAG: hypothetical protein FWE35_07555 [Streptosporangiales bacterium]|nr:hypothetical protein [Streptosporangiales bacterium]